MNKSYALLLILLSFFVKTEAQIDYQLNSAADFFRTQKFIVGEYHNTLSEKDIKGSPYLNDEFIKGSIYTVSKTQYNDIPLRYNIYNDEIEFQTPDNKSLALDAPEIVEKVTFGKYTMEYIPYEVSSKIKKGFFKIIDKGTASLYARPSVDYEAPKEPGPYKNAEPAKFIPREDRYYIRIGLEAAVEAGNKKDIISIFSDHSNEIEKYIKKEKINVRKEEGLKSLVEYYNSL